MASVRVIGDDSRPPEVSALGTLSTLFTLLQAGKTDETGARGLPSDEGRALHTYAIATRRVAGAEDNGTVLLLLDIRGQRYRK